MMEMNARNKLRAISQDYYRSHNTQLNSQALDPLNRTLLIRLQYLLGSANALVAYNRMLLLTKETKARRCISLFAL